MKKKLALLTLLAGTLISTPAMASSYINEDYVNVRTDAGTGSPSLGMLPLGTPVDVIDYEIGNGWALVNTPVGVGYMFNPYISNVPDANDMTSVASNYASMTDKLIVVNTNGFPFTYVFSGWSYNWSLEQVFPCSVGRSDAPTPTGIFQIEDKHGVMWSEGSHEYFESDFAFDYDGAWAFHSTLFAPGTYDSIDDRVGCHISNGCVRLHLQDAQWIFENCGCGTTVVIL